MIMVRPSMLQNVLIVWESAPEKRIIVRQLSLAKCNGWCSSPLANIRHINLFKKKTAWETSRLTRGLQRARRFNWIFLLFYLAPFFPLVLIKACIPFLDHFHHNPNAYVKQWDIIAKRWNVLTWTRCIFTSNNYPIYKYFIDTVNTHLTYNILRLEQCNPIGWLHIKRRVPT